MAVKVILRQTVENLGRPGEVVRVKNGYAFNFLIPQGLAFAYTEGNLNRVENEKRAMAAREAKLKADAEEIVTNFGATKLTFEKKAGPEGVLYGSVTTAEIAEAMAAKGLELDKRSILVAEAIKSIGEFEAKVRLHPEVTLELEIFVKSEDGMAEKYLAEKAAAKAAVVEEAPAEEVEAEEATEEEAAEEATEEAAE